MSNIPEGTAHDPLAPWNQEEKIQVHIELKREVYTVCCGSDDFHISFGFTICGDCNKPCSVYEEPESEYEKRLEEAESKERQRLE